MVKFLPITLLVCVVLLFSKMQTAIAQEADSSMIYQSVEIMPEPPGGIAAMRQWIGANYNYPQAAIDNGVSGNLEIKFVVERDGSLTDIQVVRDLGYGTGEEAVRIMQRARKWSPGIQNGRPVRVSYKMPISINVQNDRKVDNRTEKGDAASSTEEQTTDIFDVDPEPPGGMRAFIQWVAQNYRIPRQAIDNGASGTVQLKFIVEKDGSITDIQIVKDLGYGTGQEAVRVLKRSPKWSPGMIDGRPVRVRHTLPISLNF